MYISVENQGINLSRDSGVTKLVRFSPPIES